MPRLRVRQERNLATAVEELRSIAATARGVDISPLGEDRVVVTVGNHRWTSRVIARDAVSLNDAGQLGRAEEATIVVANQISTEAKDLLTDRNAGDEHRGWSWLDRRGELVLNHADAAGVIQFDLAAIERNPARPGGWRLASPRSDGPIRGRAGISYAAALLLDPTARPSIRSVARRAQMSHGAVGEAAKLLRQAGLVSPEGAPEIPDLFDALAATWGPSLISPVAALPSRVDADHAQANLDDRTKAGWGLGGDGAALAWGAPMMTSGVRPWIWVPTEADCRRATRMFRPATWDESTAVFAAAPTPLVAATRLLPPEPAHPSFLPTVHPLFLALDLAADPGRGREILDGWTPHHPEVHRVW